mgnify:CR=1 FL=1
MAKHDLVDANDLGSTAEARRKKVEEAQKAVDVPADLKRAADKIFEQEQNRFIASL